MLQNIERIHQEARQFKAETLEEIEQFRIRYLGKKGILADLFRQFKELPAEQKRESGQKINQLKQFVAERIESLLQEVKEESDINSGADLTLPGPPVQTGARHPISIVRNQIIDIFGRLSLSMTRT